VRDGTLSTLSPSGVPVGSPVSFVLDKEGVAWVNLSQTGPEAVHLKTNPKCSLMVQPSVYPARAVACVTLCGELAVEGEAPYQLRMDKAMYFGGLDAVRLWAQIAWRWRVHACKRVAAAPACARPQKAQKHAWL
jgi:hypothetical protein